MTVSVDNDYFNFWRPAQERPDHEYTSGVHLAYEHTARPAGVLRRLMPGGCAGRRDCRHTTRFALGHEMYTPRREAAAGPIDGERPHAGYLYGMVEGRVATPTRERTGWLEVGWVGPATRAAEVQRFVHRWLEFREPIGWEHQLPDEPVLQFGGTLQSLHARELPGGFAVGVMPQLRGELGNRLVAASPGLVLGLARGVPLLAARPAAETAFGVRLHAGVVPSLVLRNLLLDGSTFEDSHSVVKRNVVGRAQGGIAVSVWRATVAWDIFGRTREYVTEPNGHVFSRLSFSMATGPTGVVSR